MKAYISLAVISLLLIIAGLIFIVRSNHIQINSKFTDLQNHTFNLSFADEELIYDCSNHKTDTALIHKDVDNLRLVLGDYIKSVYSAGSLISQTTFCKAYAYDLYNNDLQEQGDNVCNSKLLITTEQNSAIKHDLIPRFNADNLTHQGLIQSIGDMFSDDSLIKYKTASCQNSEDVR